MLKKMIAVVAVCGACFLGFVTQTKAAEVSQKGYYINATHVNVRLSPSLEGEIIDQVNPGTQIFPISAGVENLKWTKNIYKGQVCYIYSKYISYQEPSEVTVSQNNDAAILVQPIRSLGKHKITAYCTCAKCCGSGGGKITASGTTPTVGRTIGCNWLPFGTHVIIEGHEYIVEDRGASWFKGFDIFWGNNHHAALHSGLGRKIEVFIVEDV